MLITASFWWYGRQTEELVYRQNSVTGSLLVEHAKLAMHMEHWDEFIDKKTPSDISYQDADRDVYYQGMADLLTKQPYECQVLIPQKPENVVQDKNLPKDKFEADLLAKYVDSHDQFDPEKIEFAEHPNPEPGKYQYYQAVRAKQSCITVCHQPPPVDVLTVSTGIKSGLGKSAARNPGDLLAVIKITIPNDSMQEALNSNRAFLIATAVITVFLAMVAAYVIVRYVIVKPLAHLREVSDAISHGNIGLRAKIHTGDEFEALAVAFNRMLRHLVTAQEGLRNVNADLDAKVDELAQANMQLYEMNRLKSDFLATMSHELRTPLNSILGFSDVLGSIDSLDDKQKRYVVNIQTSGRVLLDMINNILDLAKLESGKTEVKLSDFSIDQVVGAQCDMARPLTERKNMSLDADIQPGLPPLHQDQARLQQILNNLLSNAIKFTPEGGRIKVSARRVNDELVLQVADTGVGIAEEYLDVIFQKFRQASTSPADDDAMTREYTGTGLGLSIVKEICRLLGGEIAVESQLGRGSTFTVRLPWILEQQPRLDTPLDEQFEQFTRV